MFNQIKVIDDNRKLEDIYLKTIQVFNNQLIKVKEILVEQINHQHDIVNRIKENLDISDENQLLKNFSVATFQWKNNLYYFKRIHSDDHKI